MGCKFDRWDLLKVIELCFAIACLVCKTVTDDEASRLFLYLQKLSREWSLLNNVTWDKVGSAAADATYGGYVIITFALMVGRLVGELPTNKRIAEIILLTIGVILYAVLGSLEFASLDAVPARLIDNAAILGSLSLVTALLFLLDLGGPRARKKSTQSQTVDKGTDKHSETTIPQNGAIAEKSVLKTDIKYVEVQEKRKDGTKKPDKQEKNAQKSMQNGYKKMKERPFVTARKFDIYGKDVDAYGRDSETDDAAGARSDAERSPVWSRVRKGEYAKHEIIVPSYFYPKHHVEEVERPPSGPGDPGYVQYTAQRWGQPSNKTPRHSPTSV